MTEFRPFIVGDLHISDKHSGRHIDYWQDCVDFCTQITDEMREKKATHLILTGDLIGRTTEKNLQHRESLMYFMTVLQVWNQLTDGNVYSNRGNHDFAENLTDFEIFVTLGLIKTPQQLDVGPIRFHLIDYGEHARAITVDDSKYNVAIMHTNLQVEGATDWFVGGRDGVELSTLENLYGVELVLAGHIHNPSIRQVTTSIRDKDISLFYPGNGTRPRYEPNIWTQCYGVLFKTDGDEVDLVQVAFPLKEEIFARVIDDIDQDELFEDTDTPAFNIEQLSTILEELKNYNILGESDYKTQIINLGGIDKEGTDKALEYVEMVEAALKE